MELTTKGRYAVMAMADLAKYGVDAPVPLSAIAERQRLSLSYLEQLFLMLRRAELVESERGRSGGYRLAHAAGDIHVADIMAAVEEGTRMTRCADGAPGGCVGHEPCLTHDLWHALGGHIEAFLASVSLQEVVDGLPAGKRAGPSLQTKSVPAP
ncbi:MAG: Rrf2 family transcriptional regulator [Hyphomicrobium sp.]